MFEDESRIRANRLSTVGPATARFNLVKQSTSQCQPLNSTDSHTPSPHQLSLHAGLPFPRHASLPSHTHTHTLTFTQRAINALPSSIYRSLGPPRAAVDLPDSTACFVSFGTPTKKGRVRAFSLLNGQLRNPPRGLWFHLSSKRVILLVVGSRCITTVDCGSHAEKHTKHQPFVRPD